MTASPDTPAPAGITCLYADDALLALDKPSGLLAVPGRGVDKQDCAIGRAQTCWPDALTVHRLDMATSGLLLMARGTDMQRVLSQAFAAREVHKRYVAVVAGHVAPPAGEWGEIDLPLLADWPRRPLQIVDPTGKPSLTRWRILQHAHDAEGQAQTRLELEPLTGRTHQLRVHLQAMGHPILGDTLYGDANTRARSPRLLLHASWLSLTHPQSGEPLALESTPAF